jgi:hypothetical protein
MTREDQTIALMAATIYSVKTVSNTRRERRDTMQKQAVIEARELFDAVLEYEPPTEAE